MRLEDVNLSPTISLSAMYSALCHGLEAGSQLPRTASAKKIDLDGPTSPQIHGYFFQSKQRNELAIC